jgi:hypothetical protein
MTRTPTYNSQRQAQPPVPCEYDFFSSNGFKLVMNFDILIDDPVDILEQPWIKLHDASPPH